MSETSKEIRTLWQLVRKYLKLQLENFRLVSTEKTAILISSGVVALIIGFLLAVALLFFSVGLVFLLAKVLPVFWCFTIIGMIYVILGVIVFAVRNTLITDPIARFLSRLFLDAPNKNSNTTTSHN
jgi:hypothetical protein